MTPPDAAAQNMPAQKASFANLKAFNNTTVLLAKIFFQTCNFSKKPRFMGKQKPVRLLFIALIWMVCDKN